MPPATLKRKLSVGKVSNDVLKKIVFGLTGVRNPRVISGPAVGEDAAVIDYQGRLLVVKSDPITGAESNVGWLAVHVNANDIAVRGANPLFYLSTIILPENLDSGILEEICKGVDLAAKELGVTVVGGHTEVTSAVSRPVLCGAMIGEAQPGRIILSSGAKVGDSIIVTKSVALEGTAIIATDRYKELKGVVGSRLLKSAQGFFKYISVVKEALVAAETGLVHSMKDPTEGGLLQALNEVAEASKVGYSVDAGLVPIENESRIICEALHVDPLKLISSGMLIATMDPKNEEIVIRKIREAGVNATRIGVITRSGRTVKDFSGQTETPAEFVNEELWRALKAKP
ncbi:MAG: AIR synthase family protein [Promethearchaeati archaeon SRVP18_Atabeyarchaeia-1]